MNGGLDLAIEAAFNAQVAWVSDIDPGACKILNHVYPDIPNLGDVSDVDWSTVEPVDIIGGGFPCQDVSNAGRQAGLVAGTRSGLWHEFARAIRTIRPHWVVIENVRGLMSARGEAAPDQLVTALERRDILDRMLVVLDRSIARTEGATRARYVNQRHSVMGRRDRTVATVRRLDRLIPRAIGTVLGTLADLGYDAEWRCLRAADVGAPHSRYRIFILATDTRSEARLEWAGLRQGVTPGNGRGLVARGDREDVTLMPTPTTQDGANDGGPSQFDRNTLPLNTLVKTLPTPTTTQRGVDSRAGTRAGARPNLHNALLPTPVTDPVSHNGHARNLGTEVNLLPTPAVNDMGEGKTVEWWDEWAPRQKSAAGTPAAHGKSLAIEAARLLPTTTAQDADSSGNGTGVTLTDALVRGREHHGEALLLTPSVAIAEGGHTSRSGDLKDELLLGGIVVRADVFGQYAAAVARWEPVVGREAPAPTEATGKDGSHRLSPKFTEWMMGVPAGRITDAPGITRNEALKACGNGVVPQQAYVALVEMLHYRIRTAA